MSVFMSGLMRPLAVAMTVALFATPSLAVVPDQTPVAALAPVSTPVEPAAAPAAVALPDLGDPAVDLMRIGADMADRMTLPVEIGDIGPYPFLIDTGSHRSIVATELARRLSLRELAPVSIVSMAGREIVSAVQLDALRFGSQEVKDLPALSVAHEQLGSAGLIGLDSLKNKRLTLDFKKREMSIGKSSSASLAAWGNNTIVVEARSMLGQLIIVDSQIDGRRVNVILDTGAEISVGNMALFNKLKQKKLVIPPQKIIMKSVTGTPVEAQFTVVRSLKIESVTLSNVPMAFLDAAPFEELGLADKPSMLLGMAMLRMFDRVAIDFGSRHVDFQLPQAGNMPDWSNRFFAVN